MITVIFTTSELRSCSFIRRENDLQALRMNLLFFPSKSIFSTHLPYDEMINENINLLGIKITISIYNGHWSTLYSLLSTKKLELLF